MTLESQKRTVSFSRGGAELSYTTIKEKQNRMDALRYLDETFDNGSGRANYLINASQKHRYIYVETPKAACTTIKRVLQRAEVDGDASRLGDNVHDRDASPIRRAADDIDGFRQLLNDPSTFKFCFVRNPFTRSLSCYLDKIVANEWERNRLAPGLGFNASTPPSYVEFLRAVERQDEADRDIHWCTQTYLLRPKKIRYSYIGRFETFHQNFTHVCDRLGISEYLDLNRTAHATGADERRASYFGEEEIDLIRSIYRHDFENFGYGWDLSVI